MLKLNIIYKLIMDTLPTDLLKIISQYKTEIDHSTKLKKSLDKIKAIDYKIETKSFEWLREHLILEENHQNIIDILRLRHTTIRKRSGKYKQVEYYWYGSLTMVKLDKYYNTTMIELEEETTNNIRYTNVPLTD